MTLSRRRMARSWRHADPRLARVRGMNSARKVVATLWLRAMAAALVMVLGIGCGSSGASREPTYREGLQIKIGETSIEGTFGKNGKVVQFMGSSNMEQSAFLNLDLDGISLDVMVDLAKQTLSEDAHGSAFALADRAILLGLRDAVLDQH